MLKGVIGRTMTAGEGSSRAQAQCPVHDAVRRKITESYAEQLAACLSQDLVEPYIHLTGDPRIPTPC